MTLLERIKLLFVRKESSWDHEDRIVTVYKELNGKMFILHQEPIEYGDAIQVFEVRRRFSIKPFVDGSAA